MGEIDVFELLKVSEHSYTACSFTRAALSVNSHAKSITFRSFPIFSKERKRTQITQRSFAKNLKECKECNGLLQRT